MSGTEMQPGRRMDAPSPGLLSPQDDPGAWPPGELVRLIVAPALATVLLVGGIYWLRLQPPAGSIGQQQTSIVQVRLLPRPDSTPIAVAPAANSTADSAARHADAPKDPDPVTSDDPVPVPVPIARAFPPADEPPSNIRSMPSAVNTLPSSAALAFQRALLRRVKRHQRYPGAALARRLQGDVETLFSVGRDGRVLGVWVKKSSGQAVLDQEAIDAVWRAQPLPPIPPELPDRLTVEVVLGFDPP